MRRALITVAIFFVVSAAVVAQDVASTRTVTSGDNPFVLVDRFIDTFYPKLSDFGGEIVLRATHAKGGGALLAALSAEFRICATSGVPGQTYRATAPPSCGSPSEPDLKMRVYFASADGHRTIESVYVGQKAVLQKQEKLKKLGSLKGTSEPERLLENVGATFGPSNREGLVGRIPTSKVEEFTGCVLDKNTARFVFDSEAARWAVEGVRRGSEDKCTAVFEPFDGTLVSIS